MMIHTAFGGIFVVSFIIGIIAFFLGCNPNLDNQCIAYDMIQGTVYDYKFTTETCKRCVYHSRSHCVKYDYYPCYSAYVMVRYGSNDTCSLETEKDSKSQSEAQSSVDKYGIGEKENLLRSKGGSACSEPLTGMIAWGVGVAFLALSGLVLCGWLGFTMFLAYQMNQSSGEEHGTVVSSHRSNSVMPMSTDMGMGTTNMGTGAVGPFESY